MALRDLMSRLPPSDRPHRRTDHHRDEESTSDPESLRRLLSSCNEFATLAPKWAPSAASAELTVPSRTGAGSTETDHALQSLAHVDKLSDALERCDSTVIARLSLAALNVLIDRCRLEPVGNGTEAANFVIGTESTK